MGENSPNLVTLSPNKGDRIGRIFAYFVIVYFGHNFENSRSSQVFLGNFFPTIKII
jgi:hypothetical protein